MGYTIMMQWAPTVPVRTSTSELVLNRVLEHYNITHPLRSSIQIRTYRASFPDGEGTVTRILSTVTYSQPIPPVRDVSMPSGARDDCTYLFLEDRGVKLAASTTGEKMGEEKKEGEEKKGGEVKSENSDAEIKDDKKEGGEKKENTGVEVKEEKKETKDEPIEIKDDLEEDGFEIIDAPKDTHPGPASAPAAAPAPTESAVPPRQKQRFKTLAVKPATSVMPTLHNLLSPFVLGLTKQGRAGASTTGQMAQPSRLAGTSLAITTLAFPPPSHPQPQLALSVHVLPNAASTIFLEAEWEGAIPSDSNRAILEEFLLGCVPDGVAGIGKVLTWDGSETEGWTGLEKTRRMTTVLCRALRENNMI
ncbi:hypothetical protein CspeluHIS016_0308110 [Cutaneotrichosporon spelunceum]|uniref:Uncharacterized protein n=1 Tax=Cutaneotrichosporon spelunceum TaxID=1672016 RepID=A0AAD3TUX3_9TREE|nr:hypothetical protein CspeluHIS016_0308110 [Cutaneotrichosporon spelunceum]